MLAGTGNKGYNGYNLTNTASGAQNTTPEPYASHPGSARAPSSINATDAWMKDVFIPDNDYEAPSGSYYAYEDNLVSQITEYDSSFNNQTKKCAEIYSQNKEIYKKISEETGVPAQLIAAIHYRESNCNFNKSIRDGITEIPQGMTFEEDAANVIKEQLSGYKIYNGSDRISTVIMILKKRMNKQAYIFYY